MKTLLSLLLAIVPFVSFAQPILRNPMTTNRFMLALPSNGQVPAWNTAAGRWSNSTISASGGGGDQVWTNEAGIIRPVSTNAIYIYPWGGIIVGSNTVAGYGAPEVYDSFYSVHVNDMGDHPNNRFRLHSINSSFIEGEGYVHAITGTNSSELTLYALSAVGSFQSKFTVGPTVNSLVMYGDTVESIFSVVDGNLATVRGVAYVYPIAQGAAKSVQTNDGSGNLGWSMFLAVTNLTTLGATNHITFGATNAPPASAVAPTRWVSVLINGSATQYKIPLYE